MAAASSLASASWHTVLKWLLRARDRSQSASWTYIELSTKNLSIEASVRVYSFGYTQVVFKDFGVIFSPPPPPPRGNIYFSGN